VGVLLRSGRLRESHVRQAVLRALDEDRMRDRARELAQVIAEFRTAEQFQAAVENTYAGRTT
jgi:UDP:flavonoid glycosyltransferase YjiC (YdhE family)